jgi:hypothetical protein
MDPHDLRIKHASQDPDWRTPPEMVQKLLGIFPLQIDLAATLTSRVVPLYLGPDQPAAVVQDALTTSWMAAAADWDVTPCGFLNPPYSLQKIKELRRELELRLLQNEIEEQRELIRVHYAGLVRALRVESWAEKAYDESLQGFTTIAVLPYAPQTKWFRTYVMGHRTPTLRNFGGELANTDAWAGHAALDYWRLSHRVTFRRPDGRTAANANINSCIVIWGPNPGFVGPWVPSGRYWSYR